MSEHADHVTTVAPPHPHHILISIPCPRDLRNEERKNKTERPPIVIATRASLT